MKIFFEKYFIYRSHIPLHTAPTGVPDPIRFANSFLLFIVWNLVSHYYYSCESHNNLSNGSYNLLGKLLSGNFIEDKELVLICIYYYIARLFT